MLGRPATASCWDAMCEFVEVVVTVLSVSLGMVTLVFFVGSVLVQQCWGNRYGDTLDREFAWKDAMCEFVEVFVTVLSVSLGMVTLVFFVVLVLVQQCWGNRYGDTSDCEVAWKDAMCEFVEVFVTVVSVSSGMVALVFLVVSVLVQQCWGNRYGDTSDSEFAWKDATREFVEVFVTVLSVSLGMVTLVSLCLQSWCSSAGATATETPPIASSPGRMRRASSLRCS